MILIQPVNETPVTSKGKRFQKPRNLMTFVLFEKTKQIGRCGNLSPVTENCFQVRFVHDRRYIGFNRVIPMNASQFDHDAQNLVVSGRLNVDMVLMDRVKVKCSCLLYFAWKGI